MELAPVGSLQQESSLARVDGPSSYERISILQEAPWASFVGVIKGREPEAH